MKKTTLKSVREIKLSNKEISPCKVVIKLKFVGNQTWLKGFYVHKMPSMPLVDRSLNLAHYINLGGLNKNVYANYTRLKEME